MVAVLVLGVGVMLAPAIFSMFSRAPMGRDMIDDFRPYMTAEQISLFEGFLDTIGAADAETAGTLDDAPAALETLHERWPIIDDDMGTMLSVMGDNIDNFEAVDALPPFDLFPWFFVAPGLMITVVAAIGLARDDRRAIITAGVIGVGLIAAPAIFQMFSRAPLGGDMINDFRPYMTTEKVTSVQGYFIDLGAAEGALRTGVRAGAESTAALPASEAFISDWPRIANEMAPMVGVMADNVDNFAAVDALPPFPMFPWFFVIPGVMVAAAAGSAVRGDRRRHDGDGEIDLARPRSQLVEEPT